MRLSFAVLAAAVCAAAYGCATEPEQSGTAASEPRDTRTYQTGSRLPSTDGGASVTGSASKDDYVEDMRRVISPTRGN